MNFIESLIPAHLATAIGETLMHSLWELTAVAVVLLLLLQVLRKDASRLRYGLGLAALATMVVLPIATFVAIYEPAPAAAPVELALEASTSSGILALEQATAASSIGVLAQVSAFFQANAYLILLMWGLGTFLFTLRLGSNYLKVRRLRRDHTLPVPDKVLDVLCKLRDRMGVRQAVRFLQSTAIDSPMVMGALKPVILVPAGLFSGMDPQQVECIIAHELAHIRRYDYVVNLMQSMVEVVLFFHPAVWWVSHLVREERENCCDQVVVDLKADRMVYAKALLNLEVMRSRRPELAMASTGGKLFKRIQRITGKPEGNRKHYSRSIFLGLVTMGAFVILLGTGNRDTKASSPLAAVPMQFDEDQDPQNWKELDATEADHFKSRLKEDLRDRELAWGDVEVKAHTVAYDEEEQPVVSILSMNVDSPFTKVVLNQDGEEVVVFLDDNGEVVGVTRAGENLPASEFGFYEEQVAISLKRFMYAQSPPPPPPPGRIYKGKTPPAGMPVPPPPPKMKRKMPCPPPLPNMKNMPPPPPPCKDGESDRAFERRMDKYEDEMEAWAEKFEEEFEKGDWKAYEEEMEAWGEEFGAAFENQDWGKFEEDMEKWAEEFSASFDGKSWEEFGEKMGAWGEEFGAEMEEWGESFGESFGEEMEELGEEMAKTFEEMGRTFEGMEKHDFSNRYSTGIEELQEQLERDGLAKKNGSFKLKINEDELYVNGEKQSRSTRDRYADLLENTLGLEAEGEDWVEINRKKGSLQIEQ